MFFTLRKCILNLQSTKINILFLVIWKMDHFLEFCQPFWIFCKLRKYPCNFFFILLKGPLCPKNAFYSFQSQSRPLGTCYMTNRCISGNVNSRMIYILVLLHWLIKTTILCYVFLLGASFSWRHFIPTAIYDNPNGRSSTWMFSLVIFWVLIWLIGGRFRRLWGWDLNCSSDTAWGRKYGTVVMA